MPTGDVYQKSGGAYTKVGNIAGQGSSALAGLTDCLVSAPTSGQTLIYNGTQWANATAASSGGVYNAAGAAAKSIAGSTAGVTSAGTLVTLPTAFTSVGSYVVVPSGILPPSAVNVSSSSFMLYAQITGLPALTISTGTTPYALALDSAGNIYVANQGSNTVTKYAPAGGAATLTISAGISTPFALALDSAGNIYVANYSSNTVTKYAQSATVNWNAIGT